MKIITNPAELTKKLVSISSESGNEKEVAGYIFEYLKSLGLSPIKQKVETNRFNVVVVGKGDVLFNGHIDTVPVGDRKMWKRNPCGEIKDGKLYGRGSCDTKGTVACFLCALAKNPNRNINCSFTVGEENTFAGIKQVMKLSKTKLRHVKYCVNLEPTDFRIISAHKGQLHIVISTKGKAAHASAPDKGDNAILKLCGVINSIQNYSKKFQRMRGKLLDKPTLSIGVVSGGTGYNIVPDHAKLEMDVRILPGQSSKGVVNELKAVVAPADVEVMYAHDPVKLDTGAPIVKLLQGFLKKRGLDHRTLGASYTTEFSEIFKHGIQGFIFGTGSIDQAHKIDEYTEVGGLEKCHEILLELVGMV